MVKYSIICIYNDIKIVNKYLISSLNNQKYQNYEKLFFDNTNQKIKSISEGYNYIYEASVGEYLIFIHQDIYLPEFFFESLDDILLNNNIDIIGSVGISKNGTFGNQIDYHEIYGINHNTKINKIVEVESIDGCLMIISNKLFNKLKFDKIFKWNCYDTDYCLSAYNKFNIKSYVFPVDVIHYSNGTSSEDYYAELIKLINKFKFLKEFYTCPLGKVYTNNCKNIIRLIIVSIKSEIGYILKKNNVGYKRFFIGIKYFIL